VNGKAAELKVKGNRKTRNVLTPALSQSERGTTSITPALSQRKRESLGAPGTSTGLVATLLRILSNEAVQIGLLLLLALTVRMAFHFRSPAFVSKDSQSYFLPGWEIARGEPFEMGQRRTPVYPVFIAGVILAFGEELRALALAQHLIGVGTVGVAYLLGRLTVGRAAGLIAGLLVAVNGALLIYERYIMSETLFALLVAGSTLAAVAAVQRPTGRRWLLAGLALGLTILTRPVAQVLIPPLVVMVLLACGRDWRRAAVGIVALLGGLAAIQGPWVVRNAVTHGNASASTFGRTLIARTAYYDRGFVFDVPGQPHPDPLIQRAREIVQQGAKQQQSDGTIAARLRQELDLDPVEVNDVMREVAMAAILRDPVHFAEGTFDFTATIFKGRDERVREHWDEYKDVNPWDPRIQSLVGGPSQAELLERPNARVIADVYQPTRFAPLLAGLCLLGIALAVLVPRQRTVLLPAGAACLLLLASAALNGPVERYRYPIDPLISVVVAAGLTGWVGLVGVARRARQGVSRVSDQPATTTG
jgi:hypothetical protein